MALSLHVLITAVVLAAAATSGCSLPPPSEANARDSRGGLPSSEVTALLADIRAADSEMLAVSEEDGRFLRAMVVASGATRALEVGGASGYSAIWIGLGLRETGGRLTTIEYDPVRANELAANIKRAGLSDIVTVVPGDAFAEIPKIDGTFDFVFVDAWKKDYKRFYDMLLPRLEPRGMFLAHNVLNKKDEMADFLSAITTGPDVLTSIVAPSHEGISVSVKKAM